MSWTPRRDTWRESDRGTLGVFLEAYEAKVRQLTRFPDSGPLIKNSTVGCELRCFLIHKFHYAVIVGTIDGVVTIVAVAHTSREPGYWRGRVK